MNSGRCHPLTTGHDCPIRMERSIMRVPLSRFLFVAPCLLATAGWSAGPVLTPKQIQAAIQEGSKYKTADQFFKKGLKHNPRVVLGANGYTLGRYAVFFDDWQAIAAESAAAHQYMRELKAEEVRSNGFLYAFVVVS